MIPSVYFTYVACFLFAIGFAVVITKKNLLVMLMGIELMLNAVNVNMVAFARNSHAVEGQMFSLFVMIVAAAEVAVALAILIKLKEKFASIDPDDIDNLKN